MTKPVAEPPKSGPAAGAQRASYRTLVCALVGSGLCYLAQPPVAWGLLAWIAPVPWLLLAKCNQLPGRRPYLALWVAGTIFWLAAIQWIRLPYWANLFALVPMAAYLGAYLPTFVVLARVAVHRARLPLWIAGPVVWTGLEWVRGHLLTGFLMASLAHTQASFPWVIQISDLAGEYAVSFLIVLVASAVADSLAPFFGDLLPGCEAGRPSPRRVPLKPLVAAILASTLALAYGYWRVVVAPNAQVAAGRDAPTIALIQSDMLSYLKGDPQRDADVMQDQFDLSIATARAADPPIDLIVWPETMFRHPLLEDDPKNPPPPGAVHESQYVIPRRELSALVRETGAAVLVGIDRVVASTRTGPDGGREPVLRVYNSAAFIDRTGELQGTYDKMHLLPFGEFIPLADWLPLLRDYVPISGAALWGAGPVAFELDGVIFAPDICYETVVPHVIRRQVVELIERGKPPDMLVNLTNDAWFWGSAELDMHLAAGVFRAVEMRTPLVVAANRGLSAHIDHLGRVLAVTPRDQAAVLTTTPKLPPRTGRYPSIYARWGDWLPIACLVCCGIFAAIGVRDRTPRRRLPDPGEGRRT